MIQILSKLPKIFSQAVCEKIGYYVYILIDPSTNTIFYVGKGINNRVFEHVKNALTTNTTDEKSELIRKIYNDEGMIVQAKILRHGLTEELAYEIESACIDLLGLDNLKNQVNGHYSWERGLMTVEEVEILYAATPVTITEPTVIIIINRLYERHMTPKELYEATRKSWKIGKHRREKTKYAVACYRGIVREVYEIESWDKMPEQGRWGFNGKIAEPNVRDKYHNKSVGAYTTGRNPIRYNY